MDTTLVWYAVGGAALLAALTWAVRDFRKYERTQRRVFDEGLRGEATVAEVADGSARRGSAREVVLTLDVTIPGRPPFRATASVFAGQVKARELVTGARLPVLVDPEDATRVVVEPSATGLQPAR